MPNLVNLEARLTRPGSDLMAISYTVSNGSPNDILLFSPLAKLTNDGPVPAPGRVYVQWDGVRLHICKQLLPVPRHLDVYMPEVPYLSYVRSGESHHEDVSLPLPVMLDEPYGPFSPQRGMATARTIVFSLGYIPDAKTVVAQLTENPGSKFFRIDYGVALQQQSILRKSFVTATVPVQLG